MISALDLIDQAKAATGLKNFGDDGWEEGLEILVDSANREAHLNENGRHALERQSIHMLSSRLRIEDWYDRHPEIDEQEIIAPLMVLGLPRTGSTALHCLLAEDPSVRVMQSWESMSPTPPPETETYQSDPRIAIMEQQMLLQEKAMPRLKQMLPNTATSPMEDQAIMAHDFKSQIFQAMFRVPTYSEWFNHKADLVPTFRYVKRVLKLLQWRCPPTRWRLKNPTYTLFIDALDAVFPDARYAMTHRDVANVIPSAADLYFEMSRNNTDAPDKLWMGEVITDSFKLGMDRMIAFRENGNEGRFFDIHFSPFQNDPFPILENLYTFLDEEFTPEARARMHAWRVNTPKGKHGTHEYNSSDYGVDTNSLRERFEVYASRFTA